MNNVNNSIESLDTNKYLANYLLSLEEGDRILSTRELADLIGVSMGSISSALNNFEEIGAVTITRRGRLGSFLEKKSYGILWKIIENGPMVIALTLPSFPKSEGLATAIYTLLDAAGIETYLIFIRGSYSRIKALRNGRCHAAVMSLLAAEHLCESGEEIIIKYPPQSFVTDHRVFYRRKSLGGSNALRVGIDTDSFDIKYLTELEFEGSNIEYCPITFIEIDRHIEESSLDAAISNVDHLSQLKSKDIATRPLSSKVQELVGDRGTSAALIIRSGSIPTRIVLTEILRSDAVLSIQRKVVDRLMVPRY